MPTNNPTYTTAAQTPETYLGFQRMSGLVSPEPVVPDTEISFTIPDTLRKNTFAFGGSWVISDERAMPKAGAKLVYRFDAKGVFLVMRPKLESGKLKLVLNGKPIEETINVDTDRLYTLVKLAKGGDHILTLEFLDNNLELYAFTFG